ncbi:hypothetical protein OH77DRAFT_1437402 [Trametes cingulata]|nr:hypothetical protein OH77DRAFT_1437402 [Trametes cingulata]
MVPHQVFNNNASNNDKDQPRSSLKNRVQSRLQAALMPRRHIQSSSVISPSTPDSECSTLVDFPIAHFLIEDPVDEEDVDAKDYVLDAENSAWSTGKYSSCKTSKRHAVGRVQYLRPCSQGQLLCAENSAWVAARPCASENKLRPRYATSCRHPQATSGIEPEMLDPEDRAWM